MIERPQIRLARTNRQILPKQDGIRRKEIQHKQHRLLIENWRDEIQTFLGASTTLTFPAISLFRVTHARPAIIRLDLILTTRRGLLLARLTSRAFRTFRLTFPPASFTRFTFFASFTRPAVRRGRAGRPVRGGRDTLRRRDV